VELEHGIRQRKTRPRSWLDLNPGKLDQKPSKITSIGTGK
jgi:hypothetical protein